MKKFTVDFRVYGSEEPNILKLILKLNYPNCSYPKGQLSQWGLAQEKREGAEWILRVLALPAIKATLFV